MVIMRANGQGLILWPHRAKIVTSRDESRVCEPIRGQDGDTGDQSESSDFATDSALAKIFYKQ